MGALLRSAVAVLVLLPPAVCVIGLRLACGPADFRELVQAVHRDEELQRLHRATFGRLGSRRQAVREVIARRRGLGEALAKFEELDREWPDYVAPLAKVSGPQWPEEERRYRQITALVQDLLGERPGEAAAALRRLEEDYRQLRPGPAPALGSRAGGDGMLIPRETN
jgi:hypothetical protein